MGNTELAELALFLLTGLVAKHLVADYTLQSAWMIKGKGSVFQLGGYLHAGIHAVGTVIVFMLFTIPTALLWILVAVEFVVHYAIDFAKRNFGDHLSSIDNPRVFWMINGFDQLLHHLTYIALTWVIVHNL